jgi:hypothetical protein
MYVYIHTYVYINTQVSPPVKSTGLNGTYVLSPAASSSSCPANISVYQFGTQIGLGYVCIENVFF